MSLSSILRSSRRRCQLTQLELSLRLGVSQRHVSFIENGRARPSRSLLLAWLQTLGVPPAVRDGALRLAGYAGQAARPANATAVAAPLLAMHEPMPCLVFNADWVTVGMNDGAQALYALLAGQATAPASPDGAGLDLLRALAQAGGLPAELSGGGAVAQALAHQLDLESWIRPALRARVEALAGVLDAPRAPGAASTHHLLTIRLSGGTQALRFVRMHATLGAAHEVTPESLRMELWAAADETTRHTMAGIRSAWAAARQPLDALQGFVVR